MKTVAKQIEIFMRDSSRLALSNELISERIKTCRKYLKMTNTIVEYHVHLILLELVFNVFKFGQKVGILYFSGHRIDVASKTDRS